LHESDVKLAFSAVVYLVGLAALMFTNRRMASEIGVSMAEAAPPSQVEGDALQREFDSHWL
jgi:hypothetical protein